MRGLDSDNLMPLPRPFFLNQCASRFGPPQPSVGKNVRESPYVATKRPEYLTVIREDVRPGNLVLSQLCSMPMQEPCGQGGHGHTGQHEDRLLPDGPGLAAMVVRIGLGMQLGNEV